jgi:hypothetical protein
MEQLRFPRHAEEASAECRYAWIEDRIRLLAESFAVHCLRWMRVTAPVRADCCVRQYFVISAPWPVTAKAGMTAGPGDTVDRSAAYGSIL